MSIESEITRLQNAKAAIKASVETKGVTVPSTTTLDGYSALVDQISGGGGLSNTDAVLIVNVPTGSTVTATKNGTTLTPTILVQNSYNTLDSAIFSIPSSTFDANAWAVTAALNGITVSHTVVIDSAHEYNLTLTFHVPDGYQEVEYIQSSGTQYINTGVNTPSTRWGFEIDMTPLDPITATGHAILGQKLANSNEWHLNCWFNNAGYNGTLFLKGSRYPAKMTQNVRQKLSLKHGIFINAEDTWCTVINQEVGDLPVYIFCVNNNNTAAEFSSVRLYSFKIYDTTDTLVSDLYPCYRISDSVAGLWDRERELFLTNSGTGSFVVGADV